MRFLTHELDGRNRLDHVQQRLSGALIGQMALAYAGAGAQPARTPALRRWLKSTVDRFQHRPRRPH